MNGVLIGKELTVHLLRRILQDLRVGRAVCSAAVTGTTSPGFVSYPTVTTTRLMAASATWGSAWLSRNYNVRQKGN